MWRIASVCNDLHITMDTMKGYLKALNIHKSGINEKLTREELDNVYRLHRTGALPNGLKYLSVQTETRNLRRNEYLVRTTDEIPDSFGQASDFDPIGIVSGMDRLQKKQPSSVELDGDTVQTIFSDIEAFSVCLGLEDSHPRRLARSFFNSSATKIDVFEAHKIAMAALKKYGSHTISFILGLPPLPFNCFDATQIFSELDIRLSRRRSTTLRINFKNENGSNEELQITFFSKIENNHSILYNNIIAVTNKTTGQALMKVTRSGIVLPEKNAKSIIPVLQLFIRFSQDVNRYIINYGLETGYCSICGRELTDPESIRIGIGPKCRNL